MQNEEAPALTRLQGSIAYFTFEDEAFASALLSWRIEAWDLVKQLCKSGSQAEMRLKALVDLALLDGVPDTEFDGPEPFEENSRDVFDEDIEPDFDFLMEPATPDSAAFDVACANAH